MRPSTRTTLLIIATLTVPFGLFLWWTEADLRPRLEAQVELALEHQARLIQATAGAAAFSDSLADVLGETSGSRITLIDARGWVVGDSEVGPERLPDVENHAGRPEVAAALAGRVGSSVRASETVSLRLLYVAVPDPRGVLRVSVPLTRVDGLVTRSRQWVLAGGLVTLLLVGFLGRQVVRFWLRPVTLLQETLAAIGRGETDRRVHFEGRGALAAIGGSVDDMAARLEDRINTLSRERMDLRTLFDQLEDGVAQIDSEGVVVRVNRSFLEWIGRAEVTGERVGVLLRDPANVKAVESSLSGERASNESDFGRSTVLLTAHPVPQGALIVLRDLTRTRQLESVRRDFVANVSHELKTPLTNVRGFADAIADDETIPSGPREFAGRIVANATRMQALVDDLLDLSRIETGAWVPQPVELVLPAVAREVWAAFDGRPAEADVSLEIDCAGEYVVVADPDGLRQVLRNLLDNALRYAPPGSSVRLTAERTADHDRVTVTDEGPGIPSEHLGRVFERFYRVDAARSREAGGTGLGLSIVKHLTAAHGGEVGIESDVGRGTRVWFTLSVQPSSH